MRRLTTPGWLFKHALAIVLVVGCLWLGWWQIGRAAGGNALSFGYSIEWPFFAGFVVFMWVREVRLTLHGPTAPPRPARPPAAGSPAEPATAAGAGDVKPFDVEAALADRAAAGAAALGAEADSDYNRYLAWLADHPDVRPGDLRRATRATTKE
jgi:hypothetical protein